MMDKKNIIKNKNEHGAGRFGPKTRSVTKQDYIKYLNTWETTVKEKTVKVFKSDKVNKNKNKMKESSQSFSYSNIQRMIYLVK